MQFKNVSTKFIVVLMPLFIVGFVLLSSISYYIANQSLRTDADEIARGIGSQIAVQIDKEISGKMIRLDDLSSVQALSHGDNAAKVQILAAAKQRTSGFDMVCYTDLSGKTINETGQIMERGDRDYIKKVRETKKPYMSGPSISGTTGQLITVLARPVLENGELIGFVFGTIRLDNLSQLVSDVKFKETGYAYIVDQDGVVIGYGKHPEFVGKMDLSKKTVDGLNGELDDRLMSSFKSTMTTGKQEALSYKTLEGIESTAVITPIHMDGHDWAVIAAAPTSEVEAAANMLFKIMSVISNAAIVFAAIVIFLFSKRISLPIKAIRDECQVLNDGDLRRDQLSVDARDEIGQLARGFSIMRRTLRDLLRNVQGQAEQVAAASEELTAGAQQSAEASNQVAGSITEIAQGVEKQSAAINKIHAVTGAIAASADAIAEKTDRITSVVQQTTTQVVTGRQSISDVVKQMQQINAGSQTVQLSIAELAKGSNEISNIVELISSIAGQTNLLALNAAIEAARAGEQGRGFAVVAEEVRKLAEESERSSAQIADLVKKNNLDMEKAVRASASGTESVNAGMISVKSADEVFQSIVGSIDSLSLEINTISQAIQVMAGDSQTMLTSIQSIENVSQSNADEAQSVSAATQEQAASMHEIAEASQKLAALANSLQSEVEKFKV